MTALVDASPCWITAYFKETQLPTFRAGQCARVSGLGHAGSAWWTPRREGIHLDDGSGIIARLLPTIS